MKLADKALLIAALGMAFALPAFAQEDSSDLFAEAAADATSASAEAPAAQAGRRPRLPRRRASRSASRGATSSAITCPPIPAPTFRL